MGTLGPNPTRREVMQHISRAASYGNLGLFIGAGFCKAVFVDSAQPIALSWKELLERCCAEFNTSFESVAVEGSNYPQIASRLCQEISVAKSISYEESTSKLKAYIASRTSWYVDPEARERFGNYLKQFEPSWIITTNYDSVIEQLLTGQSIPLGPKDQLTSIRDLIPVYHLHGGRFSPEDIVITQEDYVSLFRPNQYRQIKLALTVKESTTIFLGYGLGDVNVLTALDWSKNVFADGTREYPNEIIQVYRTEDPKNEPYLDGNGTLVLEVGELVDFFEEFGAVREEELTLEAAKLDEVGILSKTFADSEPEYVDRFIDDENFRREVIVEFKSSQTELVTGFMILFDAVSKECWRRAEPYGAFSSYNDYLNVILDILQFLDVQSIQPTLLNSVVYSLNRVAGYIGRNRGESFAAAETWDTRLPFLDPTMTAELRNIVETYPYYNLRPLLNAKDDEDDF
ncbi:MAG TPA: SIR2 family protein [Pyrinomonadaceae bacterium]|nr:SIR2 family protein [Pyrinomonadaceae bacterium]